MRRARTTAVILACLILGSCGGDDGAPTPSPAPDRGAETPPETTPAPGGTGSLPPAFVECMADQGYTIESPDAIHSAPPQALQACFGALHQGGG